MIKNGLYFVPPKRQNYLTHTVKNLKNIILNMNKKNYTINKLKLED